MQPVHCMVEGDEIVIRVPISILPSALDLSEYAERCRDEEIGAVAPKVTDPEAFAEEVVRSLCAEDEVGGSLITRMFDDAMEHAIENGCEGVDEP